MKPEGLRNLIVKGLKSYGIAGGNPKLQAYLGSPYPVLGLSTPQLRAVVRANEPLFKQMSIEDANILSSLLWTGSTYEEKIAAIIVLDRCSERLDDESWSIMDRMIEQATGWAICDSLGSGPISSMLYREQKRFSEVQRWTRAANMWRRRVSIYAMNDFVRNGELKKPFALLEKLLRDKEFWVQRAVGTWLRECWKKDRGRTEVFLLEHAEGLPRVVITVATERAPKRFREELRRKKGAEAE